MITNRSFSVKIPTSFYGQETNYARVAVPLSYFQNNIYFWKKSKKK